MRGAAKEEQLNDCLGAGVGRGRGAEPGREGKSADGESADAQKITARDEVESTTIGGVFVVVVVLAEGVVGVHGGKN